MNRNIVASQQIKRKIESVNLMQQGPFNFLASLFSLGGFPSEGLEKFIKDVAKEVAQHLITSEEEPRIHRSQFP